jgi:hypothetical protein
VGDDPIIAESARKHGVSDEDILHAYATRFGSSTSTKVS